MKRWDDPKEMLETNTSVDENGCWLWRDRVHNDSYVSIRPYSLAKKYKVNRAHQLSYIVYKGDYDRSLVIRHMCHIARCVNPDHLVVGTQLDNLRDSFFNSKNSRIPVSVILDIVHYLNIGNTFNQILAATNIDKQILKNIINGQSYSYVSGIKPGDFRVFKKRGIVKGSKNFLLLDTVDKEMIKNLYHSDPKINSMTSLAKFYKVSLSYISRIISGER